MGATGESPVARSAEEDPTRPHVALAVEDINEARRELEERGVRHWTIRSLVGENSDQVFVPDPFGNVIELHQIGTCRCNRRSLPRLRAPGPARPGNAGVPEPACRSNPVHPRPGRASPARQAPEPPGVPA